MKLTNHNSNVNNTKRSIRLFIWLCLTVFFLALKAFIGPTHPLPSGLSLLDLGAAAAGIGAGFEFACILTRWWMRLRGSPAVEAEMLSSIYFLLAVLAVAVTIFFSLGALRSFGSFLTLFGGLFLGWSLQAPVSGFAAWILLLLKRPFRPGDRIQFPQLGLTGDVKDIGSMYVILDQVGGAIASEEPVGRHVLLPNAMLFEQVTINYTVVQEEAYMLDEVVIRITYDSKWEAAEDILLNAAREITGDIIEATGAAPYIRSELYDYGVYLRLRYQTRVKERAEIAYLLEKRIFEEIQKTPEVDMAIPYVYSYRSVMEGKPDEASADAQTIQEVDLDRIETDVFHLDPRDVEGVSKHIKSIGLLQPIIVMKETQGGKYRLLAGRIRFEACKRLGWKTIPAIVREPREGL